MSENEINDFIDQVHSGEVDSVSVGSESLTGTTAPETNEQLEVTNSIGAGILFCLGILAGILLFNLFVKRWS